MKLSEETRMVLYNQYEILKIINDDESERYEMLQDILYNGYEYNYNELGDFTNILDAKISNYVFDVLSMIDSLQISYSNLSAEDRKELKREKLYFNGFDGNEECDEFAYARFVIEKLKRYRGLGISDFNSHCNMISTYNEMLQKWEKYDKKHGNLTLEQINDIIENYY